MANAMSIMTAKVVTVAPKDKVGAAIAKLVSKKISGMPVVDAMGKVVGVVTEANLLAARVTQNVESVMSKPAVTALPTASTKALMDTMLKKKIKRIVIADKSRKLLGVVSRRDILAAKMKK